MFGDEVGYFGFPARTSFFIAWIGAIYTLHNHLRHRDMGMTTGDMFRNIHDMPEERLSKIRGAKKRKPKRVAASTGVT